MKVIADSAESLATASGAFRPIGAPFLESRFVQLPSDRQRASAGTFESGYLRFEGLAHPELANLSPIFRPAARQQARSEFVAAVLAVLHRYSQQEAVALDLYDAGSGAGAVSPAPTPIGCRISPETSLAEIAANVAQQWEWQTPWSGATSPSSSGAASAAADAAAAGSSDGAAANVALTWAAVAVATEPEARNRPRPTIATEGQHYDLHIVVNGAGHPAPLEVAYDQRLFEAATIERLIGSLMQLLAGALAAPQVTVNRLPIVSPADSRKVAVEWDAGRLESPSLPVHLQFERWAQSQPEATAAIFCGDRLTYAELDRRATQLALHLVTCGVGAQVPVAVCVLPSFDILVGMLAIFKAGGIYLPLDPTHPEGLLAAILEEAQPRMVLTQSKLRALTKPDRFPQLALDDPWPDSPPTDRRATNPWPPLPVPIAAAVTLEQPSHQLYTSGTTGKPKGVVATHGNLAHYIDVARQKYGFRRDDVFCSLARYTFSISLFELLSPLCSGGTLHLLQRDDVLAPERLARTFSEVTVVHAGPSLLGNLFRYLRTNPSAPREFPRMRHASSGGDLVPPHLLEEMKRVFASAELFVIYGCTEISCMGSTFPVPRSEKVTRSYVGKPFPDVAVRVVDAHLQLVPFGVVGEICFAGNGVVRGYFNRAELNAEKFVRIDGRTFYRTGDLGRLHADGNLEILGRRDFQIQLRGIRIELAGIENTIRTLALAHQCAVLAKPMSPPPGLVRAAEAGTTTPTTTISTATTTTTTTTTAADLAEPDLRLVAFLVKPREETSGAAWLRRALAEHLPDYMLPQHLVVLDALPLTMNGKVDRKRLEEMPWHGPAPAAGPSGTATATATAAATATKLAPRNSVEQKIAAAFATCLGLAPTGAQNTDAAPPEVGIDDDFFDLGGHSLLAVTLMDQLQNTLGLSLPPGLLFERPTVRALAEHSQAAFATEPLPIPLNANLHDPVVFVLVGVHLYRELARQLEQRYSVCAIYAGCELTMFDSGGESPTVDALARDYVQIIRRRQPHGPYRLVGMSFGGIVAYEVARQLRASGQEVAFLGLLDSVLPERGPRRRAAQLRRLLSIPTGELVPLVRTRLEFRLRRARAWLAGDSSAPDFAEFQRYGGESQFRSLDDRRQESYRSAAGEYVERMSLFGAKSRSLRPADNVTLVVATARLKKILLQSRSLGWSDVLPGLQIRNVDCDHLRLLEDPHVGEVATILLEGLARSDTHRTTWNPKPRENKTS